LPAQVSPTDLVFLAFFFVCGLALFSLGLAIALETRHSGATELAASLKYLAAFGLLHGALEWLNARIVLDRTAEAHGELSMVRLVAVVLLAGSATCLMVFGTRLLASLEPSYRWLLPLPWVLLAGWLVTLVVPHFSPIAEVGRPGNAVCLDCHRGQSEIFIAASGSWLTQAEIWARYLLYFPGSILAALALLAQRPRFLDLGLPRLARYCVGAAGAFLVNAVVAGLVVTPAPYGPASVLNYATFSRLLGLPPQLVSTVASVVVAYCVMQILNVFEIERGRQLARASAERFAAQQEALETQRRAQAAMAEWNRQLEARVQERTRQLEALHAQLEDMAVLEERDRIARELHDSLAQALGYLSLRASVLGGHLEVGRLDQAAAELEHIQQVADDAYADVREAILGLRTKATRADLVPTLEEYLSRFSLQTGIKAELDVSRSATFRFSPTVEIQLIRVIQEALSNVRKHAGAERARVRLRREGGRALVSVEDDGRGFDPTAAPASGHFGLATMRERTQIVGGELSVESAPGQGTRVVVSLPAEVAEVVEESAGGKQ